MLHYNYTGGIVGYADANTKILNCSFQGNVKGKGEGRGGLLPVNLAAGATFDPALLSEGYKACGHSLLIIIGMPKRECSMT